MAKTNKKAAAKSVSNIMQAPTLNANTYAAHNICPKNGVTPAQVLAWVQQHANGNLANVQVVPITPYNWGQTGGKGRVANATGGVRQTGLALAYNGGNLANVQKQTKAAKLGGNWLWFTVALLNGGGKRTSAAHWGTSNVQLVVQPTAS
tara:strand:+ start:157 stop:603 length:447 start_codon:yes stop_codon:yes gene_type:complete